MLQQKSDAHRDTKYSCHEKMAQLGSIMLDIHAGIPAFFASSVSTNPYPFDILDLCRNFSPIDIQENNMKQHLK